MADKELAVMQGLVCAFFLQKKNVMEEKVLD